MARSSSLVHYVDCVFFRCSLSLSALVFRCRFFASSCSKLFFCLLSCWPIRLTVYRRFYLPEPVLITVKPSSRILSHHPAFYAEISSFLSRTTCTGLFRKIQIGPNLFWLDVFIFVWSRGFQSTISKKKIEPLTVMENASSIISVLEREKIELGYIQSRVTTTTTVCRKPLKTLKSRSCFRKNPEPTIFLDLSSFLSAPLIQPSLASKDSNKNIIATCRSFSRRLIKLDLLFF